MSGEFLSGNVLKFKSRQDNCNNTPSSIYICHVLAISNIGAKCDFVTVIGIILKHLL